MDTCKADARQCGISKMKAYSRDYMTGVILSETMKSSVPSDARDSLLLPRRVKEVLGDEVPTEGAGYRAIN